MKVFITGGTGFIGSHLVDRLLAEPGNNIYCLARSHPKWLKDKDIELVKGSLQDLPALHEGISGADIVYHIAGVVKAPNQEIFDAANVDATENVLRMAMKHKVPKVVILSSLAACGPAQENPVTEDDPLFPVTMYGESKKRMEEMVASVANDSFSVTIIRPPAVYGPREEQIFSVFQMASWRLFPIIGDGTSTRLSLIHVNDLVEGILLAASEKNPGVETYFISSEDLYTWEEIRLATEYAMGKKIYPVTFKPEFVQFAGNITEKIASLIGRYPVINREKSRELGLQWICSVKKAKERLGFRQTTGLKDGLVQTIAWYKNHNWL